MHIQNIFFLHSSDKTWIKRSEIFFWTLHPLSAKSSSGPIVCYIILCCRLSNYQIISRHLPSGVNSVQAGHCWPASSSALPSVPFGSCSCSLWTSGPGAGTPSSPGVQPCTPVRRNAAPHSQCGLSSGPQGRPRPRLCGCGHGVMGRPSCLGALCWLCGPAEWKTQGYTQASDAERSSYRVSGKDFLLLLQN